MQDDYAIDRVERLEAERIEDLKSRYNEPHRYYHNWNHVLSMKKELGEAVSCGSITKESSFLLNLAIEYHDVVYDPRNTDNEFKSVLFMQEHAAKYEWTRELTDSIEQLIMSTVPSSYGRKETTLEGWIRYLDCKPFYTKDILQLVQNFKLIMKEYQFVDYTRFKAEHLRFFGEFALKLRLHSRVITEYMKFVHCYRPKIGIYAGSFNPFHVGHMSVLEQADKIFDKVIIATPNYQVISKAWVSIDKILPFHEWVQFDGLLVDYIKQVQEYAEVTLIRGLRNGNDLEYEVNMKRVNCDLAGHTHDTVYFVTDKPHVSSTVVRSLSDINVECYIPSKYSYTWQE